MAAPHPTNTLPTNVRYSVFALACGTSWLLYLHRYSFALIKKKLIDEWGLSKTELGFLDTAFSAASTGFQIPLGVAADALGVRLVLTGLILLWCVGLGLHAWAPAPRFLWPARLLMGTGQSAVYACLSRIAQTWFPPAVRTTLQGAAAITFGRLGGLSAKLVFGTLLLGYLALGWRTATWVFAASGVGFAILFAIVFRNSPREHPRVNEAEADLIEPVPAGAAPPRMTVRQLLAAIQPQALPNFAFLNIQTILSTFADNIYSNWIPLFLAEVYLLKDEAIGALSALPLLGGVLAGFCGGWLNDQCIALTGNRRWSRRAVAIAGKGLAAVVLAAALTCYHRPVLFCSLLFVVKFFGDWSLTTSWGVITDIGGRATASVFAVNNTIAGIGLLAAPPLFAFIAQHYGWFHVFVTVAIAYLLCALSWLAIDCTRPLIEELPPAT